MGIEERGGGGLKTLRNILQFTTELIFRRGGIFVWKVNIWSPFSRFFGPKQIRIEYEYIYYLG